VNNSIRTLKADLKDMLAEKPELQARPPINREGFSPRAVGAPVKVRWREFRIQVLPMLAFGVVLVLAGVLWQRAVLPQVIEPAPDPPAASGRSDPVEPLSGYSAIRQAAQGGTNGLEKAAAASE